MIKNIFTISGALLGATEGLQNKDFEFKNQLFTILRFHLHFVLVIVEVEARTTTSYSLLHLNAVVVGAVFYPPGYKKVC